MRFFARVASGPVLVLGLILALFAPISTEIATILCGSPKPSPREPAAAFTCDRFFESKGPTIRLTLPGAIRNSKKSSRPQKYVRVGQYSLKQFDYFRSGFQRNFDRIVQAINRERLDVLFLSEVNDIESLRELARQTGAVFEPLLVEGNDISKNNIAVLVRKSLPFELKLQSHRGLKHQVAGEWVPLHTRDLILLSLYHPGDPRPVLSMVNSHFKANKPHKGEFFPEKREAQELSALEVMAEHSDLESPRARIILGDFNSDVRRTTEFVHFKNSGYQEALEVLGIPMEKRTTHTGFPGNGQEPFRTQPDGIFLSREIVRRNALTSGYVVADRDHNGVALGKAHNIETRNQRQSDHAMIVVEVDITKIH